MSDIGVGSDYRDDLAARRADWCDLCGVWRGVGLGLIVWGLILLPFVFGD